MTHLTREELIAWRDRPTDASRERVVAHLGSCRPCAAAYAELIRSAPAGAPVHFDPADFVQRGYAARRGAAGASGWLGSRSWSVWGGALAAAAALILVVTLAGPFRDSPDTELRGASIELMAPAASSPLVLQWKSGFTASRYAVAIADASGTEIYRTTVTGTSATIPEDAAARLQPGRTYAWTVTALDGDGQRITSASSTFVATPRR